MSNKMNKVIADKVNVLPMSYVGFQENMRTMVAFDIDGTLINELNNPRYEIISLLIMLADRGCRIFAWSGGGLDYASYWIRRLGLETYVEKTIVKELNQNIDISFDDQIINLGKVNIKI